MYQFRISDRESSDELSRLSVATFTQAYAGVHSAENIRAYCADNLAPAATEAILSSDRYACCIAYRDAEPVGFYVLTHYPCPIELNGDSSELKQLYISSSEYGTGLGLSLLKNAAVAARDSGRSWLWLSVSDINYRAQTFYRKLGFDSIGPGPILKVGRDRLSSTLMVCRLQNSRWAN